jgi:CRISPR/Cas system CSM-associated protein Csm3 (group 7 of RAMP superfamily)
MSFENRWMIVGNLTTATPLHIGNGDIAPRKELVNSQTGQPVDINAICSDKDGRPSIPGSTLKGNLRAWAKRAGINPASFEQLFGSEDPESSDSVGGKVEFYDAIVRSPPAFSEENQPSYWNAQRSTGVMAGVAIDRRTRTASEERLFHHEFVPPGVSFTVTITGQDLSDGELEDLLFVLTGFNQGQVTLGAGEDDGWGEMTWVLTDLRRITSNEVANWINSGAPTVGYDALASIPDAERQVWVSKIDARLAAVRSPTRLTLDINLNFQSHFLVNDPSQTGTLEEGKPAHAPLRDVDGSPLLPASSFRGALRSQAEKILRTLHGEQAACYPDNNGPRPACEAVYKVDDVKRLCPVCQIFGAPGWKSPLHISGFKTAVDEMVTQEFLAIDRFTGGGAKGAKFNARAIYRPAFSGTISVDLKALERAGADRWALGLLTLALRDLIEGDIRLGFGAAKGYGAVSAEISVRQLPAWADCPEVFKADLREDQWQPAIFNSLSDDELKTVMQLWVIELGELKPPAAPQGAIA